MVKIQQDARSWLVPLLEQGQRNLGTRGHISTIVIERGSLDGQELWQAKPASAPTPQRETSASLSTALLEGEGTAGFRRRRKRGKSRYGHHLSR